MHFSSPLLTTFAFVSSLAGAFPSVQPGPKAPPHPHLPAHLPKTCDEFKKHHPYQYPPKNHRKEHHIRSSKNETDDISDELLKGIKAANHGGTLVLKKDKTYVIGKPLDLTFLDDFQLQLDGTILVNMYSQRY